MADTPQGFVEQLKAIWNRLTVPQRISLGLFSVGVLAGIIVLVYFMSSPDYQTLYSGLHSEDANAVVIKLKEKKIPYQLADGGATIRVPAEKLDEIRLQLASDGLPQSGRIGFEIFDKTNFGITDFTAQVNYRRALEGELERTIRSLSEVAQVRVHLVLPKESLYVEKAEAAKASVVLTLKSGRQLPQNNVSGITHLVSSAVEGLKPEHVSIIDAHGKVLSQPTAGTPNAQLLSAPELELQRALEKELTTKVISILEPAVGKGKVRADTSVLLDSNTSELTEELYSPNGSVILSQQKSEERLLPSSSPAGVPGTRSNQPGAPAGAAGATGTETRLKQSETTNYEVSKTVRHTQIPKGGVKKLSVAVLVDDKSVQKKDNKGKVATSNAPRTTEELERIKDLVIAAVGYNKERGDQVTVANISFDAGQPADQESVSFFTRNAEVVKLAIRYLSFILLFLLIYLVLLRPIKKKILAPFELRPRSLATPEIASREFPAQTASAAKLITEGPEAEAAARPPEPSEEEFLEEIARGLTTEGLKATALKKRVVELTKKDPEVAAQLVRAWLHDAKEKPKG
jgi:flagellar M-ring protein FliF